MGTMINWPEFWALHNAIRDRRKGPTKLSVVQVCEQKGVPVSTYFYQLTVAKEKWPDQFTTTPKGTDQP